MREELARRFPYGCSRRNDIIYKYYMGTRHILHHLYRSFEVVRTILAIQ